MTDEATPIRLPMLTFLTGTPGNGQNDLAAALAMLDNELVTHDFREPLRSATVELFYNGNFMVEPSSAEPLPVRSGLTVGEWHGLFDDFIRERLGDGALGELMLARLTENGEINSIFERLLFRDALVHADIAPFVRKYGARNCLLIQCGTTLAYGWENVPTIHLAFDDTPRRLAQLRTELN